MFVVQIQMRYTTVMRVREYMNRVTGVHTVSGCIISIHSYIPLSIHTRGMVEGLYLSLSIYIYSIYKSWMIEHNV